MSTKEEEILRSTKKKDKMQQDFSGLIATEIPKQIELAKTGKLAEAIENLYATEKTCRQGEDAISTSKVAIAIVRLCHEAKEWKMLINNLHLLAKRRGQFRSVVQDFVREAMTYLDHLDYNTKMETLEALRTITEGKIYVEVERARLTKILASIKEKEGKIGEAADIMQEIQVETFGQMDKIEKAEFILEQLRLCLDKKDIIKSQILSNKLSKKALADKDLADVKLRYYELMVRFYSFETRYLDIAKCYESVYDTPKVKEDEKLWTPILKKLVVYLALSPYTHEQVDMLNRANLEKNLTQLTTFKEIARLFLTKELINWSQFYQTYHGEITALLGFKSQEDQTAFFTDLKKRSVEHNVRVIAAYYSSITLKRLAQLLDLTVDEAEKFVSDSVSAKTIFAKIDRPKGVCSFQKQKDANESLNEWSSALAEVLEIVDRTSHLIQRENMAHKIYKDG